MIKTSFLTVGLFISGLLYAAPLQIPYTEQQIQVDGAFNEQCWDNALTLNDFRWIREDMAPAFQKTEVKACYDKDNLYFAVKCFCENPSNMKVIQEFKDSPNWENDRVELFIDVLGLDSPTPCFYISINSEGIVTDSIIGGGTWDSELKVTSGKEKDAWTLEIAIPFASMGKTFPESERWSMNLGRHHRYKANGASSFAHISKGPFSIKKADFVFKPGKDSEKGSVKICSWSRGELSVNGYKTGLNKAVYDIDNSGTATADITFLIENSGKTIKSEKRPIAPGKNSLEQYYEVSGKADENIIFRVVSADGKTVFKSFNAVDKIHPGRIPVIEKPLFKELLSDKQRDPGRSGNAIWYMPLQTKSFWSALQFGGEYSGEKNFKEMSGSDFHVVTKDYAPETYEGIKSIYKGCSMFKYPSDKELSIVRLSEKSQKENAPLPILYAPYYIIGTGDDGQTGAFPDIWCGFIPDPVNQKAYLDAIEATLDACKGKIWAVLVGDEQFLSTYNCGIRLFKGQYEKSVPGSYLRKAYEEIKNEYGAGKYSIPYNIDKNDPSYSYCNRAYISWLHKKISDVNVKVRELVKSKYPNILIIADDIYGFPVTHGAQYWKAYADIGSYQLHFYSPYHWVYMTKLVKDISGLENNMLIPHDCDSGYPNGACNQEEMRELYSQILRGGGTAIHSWPASLGTATVPIPPATASVEAGYPIAWQYLLKAGKDFRELPELKFPEADSAIYISEESAKSNEGGCRNLEYLFVFLGPNAGGWFKFISDTTVKRKQYNIGDFKAIYIQFMTYADRESVEELMNYVKEGGTLVSGDPEIFQNNTDSESLEKLREELFGIKKIKKITPDSIRLVGNDSTVLPLLPSARQAWEIETIGKDCKTIAVFNDGKPAITENRYGKGKAIYFAFTPFTADMSKNNDWKKFFSDLHKGFGCKTGHEIWRFKLPAFQVKEAESPKNKCLTGNYGFWDRFRFMEGKRFNISQEGKYYKIDSGKKIKQQSFRDGALTNRLKLLEAPLTSEESLREDLLLSGKEFDPTGWLEEFKGSDEIVITFNFNEKCKFENIKVFLSGEFAGLAVQVNDGKSWRSVGKLDESFTTGEKEIVSRVVTLDPVKSEGRELKIIFKKRKSAGSILLVPELEIWGKAGE